MSTLANHSPLVAQSSDRCLSDHAFRRYQRALGEIAVRTGTVPVIADPLDAEGERCERSTTDSGRVVTARRCEVAHRENLASWCRPCLDHYARSVRAGRDYMGGVDEHGVDQPGYADRANLDILADAIRETVEEDRAAGCPVDDAEWSGFLLGLAGYAVVGPAHYSPELLEAFQRGHGRGFGFYEADENAQFIEEQERQDHAFADPFDRLDPSEAVEFLGESRYSREGGAR